MTFNRHKTDFSFTVSYKDLESVLQDDDFKLVSRSFFQFMKSFHGLTLVFAHLPNASGDSGGRVKNSSML